MNKEYFYLMEYLKFLYEGDYKIEKSPFGDILYINNKEDTFKVNLSDLKRFNYYSLFHKNNCGQRQYFHLQGRYKTLDYVIINAFTHSFNNKNQIKNQREDYIYLLKDAKKIIPKQKIYSSCF